MKKKEVKARFEDKLAEGHYSSNELKNVNDIKNVVRRMSDEDGMFNQMIYDLGCSVFARYYNKIFNKEID